MTDGAIERRLIDYITAELLIDDSYALGGDDELLLDGFIDSIGATRLVGFIEETWSMRVPAEDVTIEHFGSVNQIAAYLRTRKPVVG